MALHTAADTGEQQMTTATFADGTTVTNPTKRPAAAAWRLVYPNGRVMAGNGTGQMAAFSKDRATAEKNAKALAAWFRRHNGEKHNGGAPTVEIAATA